MPVSCFVLGLAHMAKHFWTDTVKQSLIVILS